ncbi:GNAT family N-acetyltransferase [Dongshaea marina]|uniref:GNAT family N-acetyltransferase n=1 Tax=Dongshaea marina TaxID=2047966 RepID=UPI000D3ED0CE|nr:N-acetyltransferase [Dongshaea marina]
MNPAQLNIRETNADDHPLIRQIHEDAFGEPEGKTIAQLACDMLNDETAKPLLSLIAHRDNRPVGHILFSNVTIEGHEQQSVFILAPLAVSKECQHQGIGGQLIQQGLQRLKERDADIVIVLGDPNYYGRFGFGGSHHIQAPHPLAYPQAWLASELKPGALNTAVGIARCADALSDPEYW